MSPSTYTCMQLSVLLQVRSLFEIYLFLLIFCFSLVLMLSMNSVRRMPKSSLLLMIFFLNVSTYVSSAHLQHGFYRHSCPSAEGIVRQAVEKAVYWNPGIAAGLIRMHYHDCFVRGCDASVLLDISMQGNNQTEKKHPANLSLRGFEVIDEAKAEIEAACPDTVSCADILAFAARDSAVLAGGIKYKVPAGRHDGRISNVDEPGLHLPPPFFNLTQLIESFARKGLSAKEMVALSGAHSIGISACSSFRDRLITPFNDSNTHEQLNPSHSFAAAHHRVRNLRSKCSAGKVQSSSEVTVPLDFVTPNTLDNQYYVNLQKNTGLLTSDQALTSSPSTAKIVNRFAKRNRVWAKKYGAAMVHLGSIEVLKGYEGEIRKNCRAAN